MNTHRHPHIPGYAAVNDATMIGPNIPATDPMVLPNVFIEDEYRGAISKNEHPSPDCDAPNSDYSEDILSDGTFAPSMHY